MILFKTPPSSSSAARKENNTNKAKAVTAMTLCSSSSDTITTSNYLRYGQKCPARLHLRCFARCRSLKFMNTEYVNHEFQPCYALLCLYDLCCKIFLIVAVNKFEIVSSKFVELLQLKIIYEMDLYLYFFD